MPYLDPYDPWHMSALAAGWLALVVAATLLALRGRHRAQDHRLPLDAPVTLDVYGLAYLAGGSTRFQEVALGRLFACGAIHLHAPDRSIRAGSALAAPAHPAEAAFYQAALGRPQAWRQACYEECVKLTTGYRTELLRQDLLADPARGLALLPAAAAWCLALTLSILAIIDVAQNLQAPTGGADADSWVKLVVVFCGLSFVACCLGLMVTMGTLFRNRRGEHVLAEAKRFAARLTPAPHRNWFDLAPHDLAQAIALFGLRPWAKSSPLSELHAVLYPPSPASGN